MPPSPPRSSPQDQANPIASNTPEEVDSDSVTTASIETFPDDWRLNPTIPKELKRRDRTSFRDEWPPPPPIKYTIEPLQSPTTRNDLSPDWEVYTHFDGRFFFYHQEKRVLTEAWLHDEQEMDKIKTCIHALEQLEGVYGSPPPNSQLVLELEPDEIHDWHCWYYYADPQSRNIFWYHHNEMGFDPPKVGGGDIEMHAAQFLQREYWRHFEYFYSVQTVEKQVLDELYAFFRYADTDVKTSTDSTHSTIPYRLPGELEYWQRQINAARESFERHEGGLPWIVGRAMYCMCEYHHLNRYGERIKIVEQGPKSRQ
ncbi:hypothetical protein K435DRAFT_963368 [Dendrothele bispora CBS 962.96]|uniref:WW domain-containing protein n=1 Tax=Dendrothele bispora (strain CBS 962.96) TaxID=1314807 RepID=A0A4V4HHB0_DENBC|nr:hypothetical protein K435DRAFT_963368 [Dendrothele bispora CBS 962.96]